MKEFSTCNKNNHFMKQFVHFIYKMTKKVRKIHVNNKDQIDLRQDLRFTLLVYIESNINAWLGFVMVDIFSCFKWKHL